MKHLIFTIFVLVPLMEIAIFIEFSEAFGIWTTVTLILVSALIGGKLFQSQGLHTLQNAVASTEKNLFPAQEVFAGACIFLASLLLAPILRVIFYPLVVHKTASRLQLF